MLMTTLLVRFYDSVFLKEADSAVRRARSARKSGNASRHAGATFTAIVAAAAAAEAFLSEILAHQADVQFIKPSERAAIRKTNGLAQKFNALLKAW